METTKSVNRRLRRALLIIGGPGTGKTKLTEQIVKNNSDKTIVIMQDESTDFMPVGLKLTDQNAHMVVLDGVSGIEAVVKIYEEINGYFSESEKPSPYIIFTSNSITKENFNEGDHGDMFNLVELG